MNINIPTGITTNEEDIKLFGKHKDLKYKSTLYPVTAQGNFVETFHELVLDNFEKSITQKKCKEKGRFQDNAGALNKQEKQASNISNPI